MNLFNNKRKKYVEEDTKKSTFLKNKKGNLKIILIIVTTTFVLSLAYILFELFTVKVPVGYAGIKVNLYGSEKGTEAQGLHTGRNFYNFVTEDVYKYPIFIQQKEYPNITFQDKDGLVITASIGMDYKFDSTKIGYIYSEYRAGVDKITNEYMNTWLANAVNRSSSQYEIDMLYGPKKEDFRLDVLDSLRKDLEKKGIIVNNVYFTKDMQLPAQVKQRINAKIEATQTAMQKENELRATKAESEKKREMARGTADAIIIEAESIAEANRQINESLTPELIEYEKAKKWDGKLPTVTGGVTPFINVNDTISNQ